MRIRKVLRAADPPILLSGRVRQEENSVGRIARTFGMGRIGAEPHAAARS